MKRILFFLAFLPVLALAQVDNTIDKGSGWLYFSGIPGTTPSVAAGSEVAINALTREAYIWNRDSSAWQKWLLIDSLTYAGDTLRIYQNGEAVPLSVEITAGGAALTSGSGVEISGDSVNWNGAITQNTSIISDGHLLYFGTDFSGTSGANLFIRSNESGANFISLYTFQNDYGTEAGFNIEAVDTTSGTSYAEMYGGTPLNNSKIRAVAQGIEVSSTSSPSYAYYLASSSPSTALNDTTVMAWRGLGSGQAEPIGFLPYGGTGGSGDPDQTLSVSNDSLTISGTGNTVRVPGNGFLRDSVTTTSITVDLANHNNAVVVLKMESATNLTLTINNPWGFAAGSYPNQTGESGVYTFHFRGVSGTDNITWPANFFDMGGTALGTDALTAGTAYTCYYDPLEDKYYCK